MHLFRRIHSYSDNVFSLTGDKTPIFASLVKPCGWKNWRRESQRQVHSDEGCSVLIAVVCALHSINRDTVTSTLILRDAAARSLVLCSVVVHVPPTPSLAVSSSILHCFSSPSLPPWLLQYSTRSIARPVDGTPVSSLSNE